MNRQPPRPVYSLLISLAVFGVATFLRLPSCYESLWLDELHSAWIVADNISNVYQRSIIGHQSPCYYFQLWAWQQAVGDSELMLRLNSVLMVAGGCSVLALGISRWTQSPLAGLVAGLLLAIENNSLFFGTELRPFALVILCSSISTVVFLRLLSSESRHQHAKNWCLLINTILVSAICQPTSLGVLAWLPLCLCGVWFYKNPKQFRRFTRLDAALITVAMLTILILWQITLRQSWEEKSMWGSFATATNWQQIWSVWNWPCLLLIPSIPVLIILLIDAVSHSEVRGKPIIFGLGALAGLTILATCLYWCLSKFEMVPVWHRRYFIAVLPMLACFGGACLGYVQCRLRKSNTAMPLTLVLATSIILCLGIHQGIFKKLAHYPVALVKRGEDWRQAIEWLEEKSKPEGLILLDSGLIEGTNWITTKLFEPGNEAKLEYLCFPVHGPYRLNRVVVPIGRTLQTSVTPSTVGQPIYILTRNTVTRTKHRIAAGQVLGFGGVCVVIPGPTIPDLR